MVNKNSLTDIISRRLLRSDRPPLWTGTGTSYRHRRGYCGWRL